MDLTDVLGSTIQDAGFDDHEFEELVAFLLGEEADRRHRGATVTGPTKKGKGDGGRDIQVTVHNPPKIAKDDAQPALTWDDPGTTWYSCKTATRQRRWLAGVKKDVGWKYWVKNTPPKTMTRPSVELLEALAHGARYVVVINEQAGSEDKFLDNLAQVFKFWFAHHPGLRAPLQAPVDFRHRLELIDANFLARIIRAHKPQLRASIRDKLGAIEPKGLQSWESWSKELSPAGGREPPKFVPDAPRMDIFDALQGVGPNATKRVLRVFGAPGVGKTRTVHHGLALLGSAVTARVRYCNDIRRGQDIVESGWLPHAGALVLILDEARTTDVPGVVSRFLADATSTARLILVGTSDEYVRWEHDEMAPLPLAQLDLAATRQLIVRELGADDPRIESVLHLSEGYPLFAVYLARALLEDGDAIDRPRDGGTEEWLAAQRVLAGSKAHYNMDHGRWEREVEIRAKCLLVVLLAWKHEVSWDDLWSEHHHALAAALDEVQGWEQVKQAERKCVKREILRYSGGKTRRYVSPRNLARIIINHFFGDDGPDLGPKIRRHLPQLHSSLHTLAERLSVRPEIRDRLARGEWEGIFERISQEGAESWVGSWERGDGLYHAARRVPEVAAFYAKLTLDRVDDETLARTSPLREALRVGLQHLRHRKLSAEGFTAVESALLRLARFDHEPRVNTAMGLWQSLFYAKLDHTHHPWPDRLKLLKTHLTSPDVTTRNLATIALGTVLDRRERGPSVYGEHDLVDAPWPGTAVSSAELGARKHELWSLLIAQCEDTDPLVSESARSAVTERFCDGVRLGLDVALLQCLQVALGGWTSTQRQRLSEVVDEFRPYDSHSCDEFERAQFSDILAAVDALSRALEPMSFQERLLEQVGHWSPWRGPVTDDEKRQADESGGDDALVTEALEDPALLLGEIVWLTSEHAKRKSPFSIRLGERDVGERFLGEIEAIARSTGNLVVLTRYLEGWSHRDAVGVDGWLESHAQAPLFAKAVAAVVPRLPPSRVRLSLLRKAIGVAEVESPWLLQPLQQDSWIDAIPTDEILGLLEDMLDRPSLAPALVMIGMAVLGRDLDDDVRQHLLSVLSRSAHEWTSERIVMVGQPTWRRTIMALWQAGRREAVVDALLAALDIWSTHGANVALAAQVLVEVFATEGSAVLWNELVRPMLEREPSGLLAEQLARVGLLRHVSADVILEWVGSDVGRGILAAHMVTPHGPELEELGCNLLVHFGDEGPVANQLHARARSWISTQSRSIYEFEREQLDHAEVWSRHSEPEVRRWAKAVADRLRASLRQSEARANLRRHYG